MKRVICETTQQLAHQAATAGAEALRHALQESGEAVLIVATGVSQFQMLAELVVADDIAWDRVTVFHLDEYVGLPEDHPASFRRFLQERFVSQLPIPPRAFHAINGEGDCIAECQRLKALIAGREIAVAFVGIGENGHLAFNDPPADFETEEPYLLVTLDEACRRQQVGEGWFPTLEDVPTRAISMSIRQILKSKVILCLAPGARKAKVVQDTIEGPVTPMVPASCLQQHSHTLLYLDKASAREENLCP